MDGQIIEGFEGYDKGFGFYQKHMEIIGAIISGMISSDLGFQRTALSTLWSIYHV